MRKGGGKAKGSAFERTVCQRLSLWVSNGTREDIFWRSAMSGGRGTRLANKGKQGSAVAGDICAVDPMGAPFVDKFFVECKFYKDLSLLSFFFGKGKGKLHEFWHIAREQAHKHKKMALLIARQNLEDTIVLVERDAEFTWSRNEADPIAYLVLEEAFVYWFDDIFPKPKPRVSHGRTVRK